MTRDTRNRKTHDETPSNDKEQDVTFENIVGMENYQHQQLNELHDTERYLIHADLGDQSHIFDPGNSFGAQERLGRGECCKS
ncbi:Gamma-tubulin complex component 5 [Gossypium arboreum]|uniref:Gamma-tubulin complex component 5 n=1 Tax=Gossypium arboreum TaxID=29729 RepID=A0A0B0MSW6_GOSAR|nr:Gamma-tubulin complex component 5 [Gossypium arboreum]